jgi:hypothetical protein
MMRDWHPDVMHPDPGTPAGMRAMLTARYRHLNLAFTVPAQPGAGLHAATWDGAQVEADTEQELIRLVLEELMDCGAETHDWVTVSQAPDPLSPANTLLTQQLRCAYCDPRQRVITLTSPPEQASPD